MGTFEFKFYKSYTETFDNLTDEQAGKLLKRMYNFYFNGSDDKSDAIIEAIFSQIKYIMQKSLIGKKTGSKKQVDPPTTPPTTPPTKDKDKDKDKYIYILTKEEIYQEIGKDKLSDRICDIVTELKYKKPIKKNELKDLREFIIAKGQEKIKGFYKDNTGIQGGDLLLNKLDGFYGYFLNKKEIIASLKGRILTWFSNNY